MIQSQDRSGYIGASDTSMVVGNWKTKTFEKWWLQKLGLHQNHFTNEAMMAGTNYEHKILDALDIKNLEKDKQIIIGRLRVNLDGNTEDHIYEVKTHNIQKPFIVSIGYWRQAQVEMYATDIRLLDIVEYSLTDKDYKNYLNPIDKSRIAFYPIEYDENFIQNEYLPKLKILEECLIKGIFPEERKE